MSDSPLNLKRESLISFSGRGLSSGIGLVSLILLARLLGPEKLGLYFVLLAGAQVAALAVMGMGKGVQKRVSEINSTEGELLGFLLVFTLAYGGLVVAVAGSVYTVTPILSSRVEPLGFIGFCGAFIGISLFMAIYHFYSGIGNPGGATWYEAVQIGGALLIQLSIVLMGGAVGWLLLAYGVSGIIAGGTMLFQARIRPVWPSWSTIHATLNFSRWTVGETVFRSISMRGNPLLLGSFTNAASVGLFEAAARLSLPGLILSASVSDPLLVSVSESDSEGDTTRVNRHAKTALQYSSLLAIPVFFGALALGTPLLQMIYGVQYGAAALVLYLITFARIFTAVRTPLDALVIGRNTPHLSLISNGTLLAAHIVFGVLLTIKYGMLGLAVSIVLAEVLSYIVLHGLIRKTSGGWFVPNNIDKQILAAVIMYLVIVLFRPVFPITSGVSLGIHLLVGAVVFFLSYDFISRGDIRKVIQEGLHTRR